MPRQSLDVFLTKGELRGGADDERGIVTNEEVRRPLQPGTERNYDRAGGLWEVYAKRKGCAQLDDFKMLKVL